MAACVETMFSVRETPWHGLGTIIQEAPSSEEALKLAGLDWNVIQRPVYMRQDLDGSGVQSIEIPGYKVNVRDTDNQILGMVTDRYSIVQNRDAFAFTDALLGEGVRYETAGSLSKGKRVWMLAKLEGRIMTDEAIDPYLVFTNSHDGTGAIRVAITPVRVVCQNTLNFALQGAKRQWSCIHVGNIDDKLDEAYKTLLNAETYLENLEEHFGELKLKKITDDKVKEFVEMLLPLDPADIGKLRQTNVERMREDLMYRYLYAPDLIDTEKSAYRFVNAVSDFATHREPARRTSTYQENLFMKTVDGNAMIDKANELVLSLV